jgi:hypothetical protein
MALIPQVSSEPSLNSRAGPNTPSNQWAHYLVPLYTLLSHAPILSPYRLRGALCSFVCV